MSAPTTRIPLRTVALPNEHGGWGFTLEPILLGLLVAPGWAGTGLALFALAAFFTRHPLKLWLADLRRGKTFPRTLLARRFALIYAAVGSLGLALALSLTQRPFWIPLLAAAPLIALQLWFDARQQSRQLLPELSGAVAMGAVATGIALANGQSVGVALGLWLVLAARAVGAILYARIQVRRARSEPVNPASAYWVQAALLAVSGIAVWAGLVPPTGWIAVALLLPLSVYSFGRPPVPARVVGWTQMVLGLVTVVLTALGYQ